MRFEVDIEVKDGVVGSIVAKGDNPGIAWLIEDLLDERRTMLSAILKAPNRQSKEQVNV